MKPRLPHPAAVAALVVAAGLSPWLFTQVAVPVFQFLAEAMP
jgi:hypothetical protein